MIEKFCKKADKTKAELLELLNDKKTQNDTLEKLVIFISNFNKKCIISTFDGYREKGKIGKQFLGFEHSERKKYEGIRPFPNNEDGVIRSQLYTDENVLDDKKVNYYFYKAFRKQYPEIHENLKDNFTSIDNNKVLTKYVYYLIKDKTTNFYKTGQQYPQFNFEMFNNFQIPIPPIQTQQQIVEKFDEIEKKQEEGRRKIASNNNKIFEVIEDVMERKEPIIFTEFVKTIQPRIKLQKQEWLSKGDYPIISQETNNLISGYPNNEEAVIKEKPIIAFGDHILCVKYIDFDFCYGADGMQLLKVDNTKIDTKLFSYILKNRLKEIDDKKYSRHFSKVKMLKFLLPSLETQHQLLQQINQIEKENEELKSEAEVLEQQKKEFLDKYLK